MSFLARLFARSEPKPESRSLSVDSVPWVLSQLTQPVTVLKALSIPAVFQATSSIADMMSCLPLPVYKRTPGGGWDEDDSHPLNYILNAAPNDYQTAKSWRHSQIIDLLSQGEHFSEIEWTLGNKVKALWRIEPSVIHTQWKTVPIEYGGSTSVMQYFVNGKEIDPSNLLHIVGFTIDGFRGVSPFNLCQDSLSLSIAMQRFSSAFFRNGARPGGILTTPAGLAPEDMVEAREQWRAAQGGPDKAGETAVLPPGFKYDPLSLSPEEAQYEQGRLMQMREAGRITRATPHLYGDYERQTWANISYAGEEMVRSLLRPMATAIEQEMNRKLVSDYQSGTHYIEHDLRPLTAGSFAEQIDSLSKACGGPVLTPNEARERLAGLPPVPGGDVLSVPVNMAPAGAPPAAPDQGGPDQGTAPAADQEVTDEPAPIGAETDKD